MVLRRLLIFGLFGFLILLPVSNLAQTKTDPAAKRTPSFAAHPVKQIYRGRPHAAIIDTRRAHRFRTRLREDAKEGPNFAGHYTVAFWGCGSGCAQMAVVDALTGRVFWPPFDETDIPDDAQTQPNRNFRLDSRLLIVTQNHYDGKGGYTAYYYLFDRGRFRLIRKAEETFSEQ